MLECCEFPTKEKIMELLGNVRVRHSMLLGVYVQMKNYLECVEHGYLGQMEKFEETLVKELKNNLDSMEEVLWGYFDKEESIMNP